MRRLLILTLLLLALTLTVTAQTPRDGDNPWGVVEGFWLPELTCDLGVSWERIIFDWAQHQPTGPEDWNTLNVDDRWLAAANACDREVVAIVKSVPEWATDGLPGAGVPRGLDLPIDDPGNLWANFMRRAAEYYASRGVHRFIILNEPDIKPGTFGFEFEGTMEDYAAMLRVGYLAAKQGNPSASIHLAGTTYWHDANTGDRLYMDRLLEYLTTLPDAAENGYFFDVLSLHIYFRSETVPFIVGVMRDLLEQHGLGAKAIWINETNAAPTDDPAWPVVRPQFPLNLTQQSAYLVQAASLAMVADVERVGLYKLWDQGLPEGGESFGVIHPATQATRPAYDTWRMVTTHFTAVESADWAQTDTANAVHMHHRDGRATLVLWARTGQGTAVTVSATSDKAYLIDQYGGVQVVRPQQDGLYLVSLPGATCDEDDGCFIGGETWTLVQPDGDITVTEVTGDAETVMAFDR